MEHENMDEQSGSEEDLDNNESDNDQTMGEAPILNVDMGGRCAEDSDFPAIRKYLQQLFLKSSVDTSELANQIIAQNYIGCILYQVIDDDDDESDDDELPLFGVCSVINITDKHDMGYVKSLKTLLMEWCDDNKPQFSKEFKCILNDPAEQVGLVINERAQFSSQIALPTFEALWDDVDKAVRKKMKYNFTRYLMIAKTRREIPTLGKKKKSKAGQPKSDVKEFVNMEEELFYENAKLTFDFSVQNQSDTITELDGATTMSDVTYEPLRTVILLDADKIPVIMSKMRTLLSQ